MLSAAALLYALLATCVALFQVALVLGAPWGHLTMGGRRPGRLLGGGRVVALVSGLLMALMAVVVLGRAGVVHPAPPGWLFWTALGVTVLTSIANLATPSIPERRLWGPVALVMLVCIVRVALG